MNKEKWDEICFLLSENVRNDISESDFEQQVAQALRVLDWKEYSGDIEIRPSFPVGSVNRITPDFVINSSDNRKLFVIEIKQPNIPLNSRFQQQLFSYMRQLKLEFGILIGQSIQIFYDGELLKQEDPILLETINFAKDNEKGLEFVELFTKENFNQESLKAFTIKSLKKINRRQEHKKLTEKILSENFQKRIFELIKQDFLYEYDGELVESVLDNLNVDIKHKDATTTQIISRTEGYLKTRITDYSGETLPIQLNPSSESEFKRRLLAARTAYITTFYKDGTSEQELWNANRFKETSSVLGNLRSRPKFRNRKWQELGIKKVYVSIEK